MEATLRDFLGKINISGDVLIDEPMAQHTTFRVGGPADCVVRPSSPEEVSRIITTAEEMDIPVFVLGGGANILVGDDGVRGVVVDMGGFSGVETVQDCKPQDYVSFTVGAGGAVSDASAAAADGGLSGLEFIYAMPGSVGGAVWMNARCYGSTIADILAKVEYIDAGGEQRSYEMNPAEWGYKVSPFQQRKTAILAATFRLRKGNREDSWKRMMEIKADRERKGHFAGPCAGSVFKNNRDFGAPSGRIIDSLGLRGMRVGGAVVSPAHANIIINTGNAGASDIRELMDRVQEIVLDRRGVMLEPEVLLVGAWEKWKRTVTATGESTPKSAATSRSPHQDPTVP